MELKKWLGEDNELGMDIWKSKYKNGDENLTQWIERVSGSDEELSKIITDGEFLFGGRALSNRGTDNKGSYFNCYSEGYIGDSLDEILEVNSNIAKTFKAQGGEGVSFTKIRPKGTKIGNSYKSDGIIPFMRMLNETTRTISQGGSRKGALMMSLDITHKEAEDFIKVKAIEGEIDKANLSLEVDDEFMNMVKKSYADNKEYVMHVKKSYGGNEIEYDIVPIKLFRMMAMYGWNFADPAILYTNEFRNYNLMEFIDEYQIETSNPCKPNCKA